MTEIDAMMTPARPQPEQLLPGLWRFEDHCNVYVVQVGERAIAVDFGSGRWLSRLPELGIQRLEHVFLTHHHADQCAGLQAQATWPFTIHAPAGEQPFLDPALQAQGTFDRRYRGCPNSYKVLRGGVPNVRYDTMAGFTDTFWGNQRIRFIHTPGHGPNACSVILDHAGKQVVFCGDAAHAGATLWEPYHLEWDHWTGAGALAAWEGVLRLHGVGVDLLCPAHGPVVQARPRAMLKELADRLIMFYQAKGQISPGENDDYLTPVMLACGARQVLPNLYQFGENGYLLCAANGEGLVIDPFHVDMPALNALLDELSAGGAMGKAPIHITATTSTHYHADHCDAAPELRERFGARVVLHPWVAEALAGDLPLEVPWLPLQPVTADELWPQRGTWQWNEYEFMVAPWPGQTRWHCAFMASIAGQRVLWGGDSFQPSSRWNGTGGFCAYNGSRFTEGFAASAQLVLDWKPQVIACGHSTYYRFHASRFNKIKRWAKATEKATTALCPSGNLEQDYYAINRFAMQPPSGDAHARGELFWLNATP
jgi:glyoxylase-like metal-dependent hydrolase (beta-lactamase superfamily II)